MLRVRYNYLSNMLGNVKIQKKNIFVMLFFSGIIWAIYPRFLRFIPQVFRDSHYSNEISRQNVDDIHWYPNQTKQRVVCKIIKT